MFKWWVLVVFLLSSFTLLGQETPKLSMAEKDSVRYTRLKERFYKRKITKRIYKLFFRDIYNRNSSSASEVAIETNPFDEFEGKIIRSITIEQLRVLGQSIYDTTRQGNKFEKFVSNKLHTNTQERRIKQSLLLFKERDLVNPELLKDNERILRQSSVLLDARILVELAEDDEVNVTVLVQDVWPIEPIGSFSGLENFRVGLKHDNVRGMTHSSRNEIRWRGNDTIQKFGIRSIYTIPYIKRTFITGQAGFIWEKDLKQQYFLVSRPFVSVEMKYAGAFEAGVKEVREYRKELYNLDKTFMFPVKVGYYDAWFGRAFKLGSSASVQNKRLVTAVRFYNYKHLKRPEVSADSNRTYWNQNSVLFSLGFSNRDYKRDLLIFGFGRTEDVPIGSLLSFTVGRSSTEYGSRGYAGGRFSMGKYLPNESGYLYALVDAGTYVQKNNVHQGVLSASANYFTPLMSMGLTQFRQFVNLRYTVGLNRDELEYINVTDTYGIRGVYSDRLVGKKRLNLGMETVLFAPGTFLGFRSAPFAFGDFGLITNSGRLWSSKLYQAYGLGIRLRNENLTFNTIEFRIAYYPNIPALSSPFRFGVSGATSLQLQDFDISAPQVVPLK